MVRAADFVCFSAIFVTKNNVGFLAHLSLLRVSFEESVNVRRPSVVRPQLLVNTLAVAFLPQSSSNLVRMLI
jgi:hypothetical protein